VAYFGTLLPRGTEGKLLETSQDRLPHSGLKPSNYRTQVRLVTTFVNLLGLVMTFTLDCHFPCLVQFCKAHCHTSGVDRGKSFWLSTMATTQ